MHVKRAHVLGSIFRWTSAQYNSDVQTADCLYNECIRKRCSFQRKIFTCKVASFGLFQNRLLDSAGLALKRKVRLTYAQTRAWLQRIEPIVVRRFLDVVSVFFAYTDVAVVFAANCLRNPLK